MRNTYGVSVRDEVVTIDFIGDCWELKEISFTFTGMTHGEIGERIKKIAENNRIDKYHVLIRTKDDNKVVWTFTINNPVSKEEAERIAEAEKEGLNHADCYISIEKE